MSLFIQDDPALKRKKMLAEMMLQNRKSGPVQHWTQGANKIAQALAGSYFSKKASDEQDTLNDQGRAALAKVLAGGGGFDEKIQQLSQVPNVNQDALMQMQLQRSMQPQARDPIADYRAKKEIDQDYPKPESEFDQYLKSLRAEKLQTDIDKGQAKVVEATKAQEAEQSNIQHAADLAVKLRDEPAFDDIYGSVQGLLPSFRQGSVDAEATRDQLLNVLTLAARGQLKGQGQITEGEQKMLKDAQSMLSNPRISDEEARVEVNRVVSYLTNKGAEAEALPSPTSQEEFDSLPSGTVYIDPDDGKKYRKP